MTIQEKYLKYKNIAKTGDIMLFRGTAFISKAIELFDKAYFSHSAVILKNDDGLKVIQSTINKKADGMEIYSLEKELQGDTDFVVLRPVNMTDKQISNAINGLNEKIKEHAKYNILFYVRFLLYLAFKWDDKSITQKNAYVCSQAVQLYTDSLGIKEYKSEDLITPQYIWDNKTSNNILVIIDKN